MPETLRIGLDIGSTTIKCVVLNEADKIIYSCYERHLSLIAQKTRELLTRLNNEVVHGAPVRLSISGSAGMGLALGSHISFVQEVYATKVAADMLMPGTDVIIELGGEDAKILFLQGTLEVRMNGSCAGGTGAFIDQMATLLGVTPTEMNEEAKRPSAPIPSLPAAAYSPRRTCSPCSIRARRARMWRALSSWPWSTRPSRGWRRVVRLRATSSTSAARSPS